MATPLLTRALSATYSDPVDAWKRQALENADAARRRGARFGFRAHFGFGLVVMVAGAPLGVIGGAVTLLTLLSVVLLQELPLALSARVAKRTVCVVLSARGSDTKVSGPPSSTGRVVALLLVGALANLSAAAVLSHLARRGVGTAAPLLSSAVVAHALWGVGQALPFTPFRAGRAIARRLRPPLRFAHAALSFLGISVTGLWVLRAPGFPDYFSILVLATIGSAGMLWDASNELRDQRSGVATLTAAARARLGDDQPEQALALAQRALASACVESNRTPLLKILAWAAIGKRDPFTAHGALHSLAASARDLHLVAAYLACCNRTSEAIALLREARHRGHRARETSMLLVDLLYQADQQPEARAIAERDRGLLTAADWNAIQSSFDGTRQ